MHRQRQSGGWQLESGRALTDMWQHLFGAAGWVVLPWDSFLMFHLQLHSGHTRKELKRLLQAVLPGFWTDSFDKSLLHTLLNTIFFDF